MLWWTLRQLRSSDVEKRRRAVEKLGDSRNAQAIEPLVATLRDEDEKVRQDAVTALGKIGTVAIPRLVPLLQDLDPSVRLAAAEALSRSQYEPEDDTQKAVFLVAHQEWEEVGRLGALIVKPILIALSEPTGTVRDQAAASLRKLGHTATPVLIDTLRDPDWNMRQAAAAGLGIVADPRAREPLAATLRDQNKYVRWRSIEALKVLGHKPADEMANAIMLVGDQEWNNVIKPVLGAVEQLIWVLRDPEEEARKAAAAALGKIGDLRALDPLILALTENGVSVRREAAAALGRLRNARAIDGLIAALHDPDWPVQQAAVAALAEFGDQAANPLAAALERAPFRAAEVLALLGDGRAVDTLLTWLKRSQGNATEYYHNRAAQALGKLRDPRAAEPLVVALQTYHEEVHKEVHESAAEALVMIGEPAVEPLIAALKKSRHVPSATFAPAKVLGRIGSKRSVELLIAVLRDHKHHSAVGPALALGMIGDPRAVDPLIGTLRNNINQDGRTAAATALGKIGDERAIEPLVAALGDDKESVRRAAAVALGMFGDARAIEPLTHELKDWQGPRRVRAAEALQVIGEAAVQPLIDLLGSSNANQRGGAAFALGLIGDVRAVDGLIVALGETIRHHRWSTSGTMEAASALGKLGDDRAVGPLISTLIKSTGQKEEVGLTAAAAEELGNFRGARAVEPLIDAVRDSGLGKVPTDFDARFLVRRKAVEALGKIGDERAIELLVTVLRDPELGVRLNAAVALGRIGNAAIDPIIELVKDPSKRRHDAVHSVRTYAGIALANLGESAVGPLLTLLDDPDEDVRRMAALALGMIGTERAIDPLITALSDSDAFARERAAWALGVIGDVRAVEQLLAVNQRTDENTAAAKRTGEDSDHQPAEAEQSPKDPITSHSPALSEIVVFKTGAAPPDEKRYFDEVCRAIELSPATADGVRASFVYVKDALLNEMFVIAFALKSGFPVERCLINWFTDREGNTGLVMRVPK